MGVLGLWQLLTPVGQPVTLESLENKILAVDISIWLNQAIKGYRDRGGGNVPNAHLLSLFSRLCKLLYYKIRPIMVFDGSAPELKKQTIINRQKRRNALKENSRDAGLKLLTNFIASQSLHCNKTSTTSNKTSTTSNTPPVLATKSSVKDDIFILPPLASNSDSDNSDNPPEPERFIKHESLTEDDMKYLNEIDIDSDAFQALPPNMKQEILSTLKESRKHKHWSYYENLPTESHEFSSFQMQGLLKRRKVQSKLEEVHRDLQKSHCTNIVALYGDEGAMLGDPSKIMSDDCSHYIFLKKDTSSKSSLLLNKEDLVTEISDNTKENLIHKNTEVKISMNNDLSDKNNQTHIIPKEKLTDPTVIKTSEVNEDSNTLEKIEDCYTSEMNEGNNTSDAEVDVKSDCVNEDNGGTVVAGEKSKEKSHLLAVKESAATLPYESAEICINSLSPLNKTVIDQVNHLASEKEENNKTDRTGIISENNHQTSNPDDSSDDGSLRSVSDVEPDEIFQNFSDIRMVNTDNASQADIIKNRNDIRCETNNSDEPKPCSSSKVDDIVDLSVSEDEMHCPSTSQINTEHEMSEQELAYIAEQQENMQRELEESSVLLQAEQAKLQRQANTVQEHMVEECKDLLRLFGVPYIVSPMEAEAQCAFYDLVELTHGTITDDSDIWLFGGKRVYKNFFAQKKYVEFFKEGEIKSHFNLDRKKLICFAMLTGSDYTEGIENVGPVTAMEILSEFVDDGINSLLEFKDWWEKANKHATPPKNKVRAKFQKLTISDGFPNHTVFETYLNPEVDNSTESFSWGLPDLDALRDYTKEKFGWSKEKVDDSLLPVIKRLNERTAQTHLDSFFTIHLKKEKNLFPSKRITSALKKINPTKNYDDDDDKKSYKSSKKGKATPSKRNTCNKKAGQGSNTCGSKNIRTPRKSSKIPEVVELSEESSCDDPSE